ncbi:MAG: DUF1501 domain-containing protein [Myxococcota bacterium]|nr:DUF1501 domain-containing protein [Myxococcota bacterium]
MTYTKINRRRFLQSSLATGAGLGVFGGSGVLGALAQRAPEVDKDIHYVFAYFSGGWDILLGLDPRDPAQFNSGNMSQTRIQPGYELLNGSDGQLIRTSSGLEFGPYIGMLAQHHDKLAVVRGMSMETLTHEAGRRRFITGKPPSGLLARGSSMATVFAAMHGAEQPIPNLSVRVESYNIDQPNYATALRTQGVPDLIRALRPSDPALSRRQNVQLDQLLSTVAQCPTTLKSKSLIKAEEARKQALQMTTTQLDRLFDFQANNSEMEQLRSEFAIPGGSAGLQSPEAQTAMAAQAIMNGISRTVSIQASGGLDTHFNDWENDQGPRQQQGFDAISRLITKLESSQYKDTGDSWLDHTVIVGFSEFSRTPMLNARGGRDHSLTGACFLAGAGIQGGVAVGASSNRGMEPQAINLSTGSVDLGGEVPKPEHVLQTLMFNAGHTGDEADLRVYPIEAIRRG